MSTRTRIAILALGRVRPRERSVLFDLKELTNNNCMNDKRRDEQQRPNCRIIPSRKCVVCSQGPYNQYKDWSAEDYFQESKDSKVA